MKARTIEPNQRLNCVNPVNMRLMNNIRPNNESHYLNVSTITPNAELFLNGFYVILTIIIPYLHENEGKLNHKQTDIRGKLYVMGVCVRLRMVIL